jgi:hypothetical protein
MNLMYLSIAAFYTLYFYWLITTDAQATMHAHELAAVKQTHKGGY